MTSPVASPENTAGVRPVTLRQSELGVYREFSQFALNNREFRCGDVDSLLVTYRFDDTKHDCDDDSNQLTTILNFEAKRSRVQADVNKVDKTVKKLPPPEITLFYQLSIDIVVFNIDLPPHIGKQAIVLGVLEDDDSFDTGNFSYSQAMFFEINSDEKTLETTHKNFWLDKDLETVHEVSEGEDDIALLADSVTTAELERLTRLKQDSLDRTSEWLASIGLAGLEDQVEKQAKQEDVQVALSVLAMLRRLLLEQAGVRLEK